MGENGVSNDFFVRDARLFCQVGFFYVFGKVPAFPPSLPQVIVDRLQGSCETKCPGCGDRWEAVRILGTSPHSQSGSR